MANPISDIVGGIAGLTSGGSYGPRQSVRLAAQGTMGGYSQTLPLRLDMDQIVRAYQLQQGGQDLYSLLMGAGGGTYSVNHDAKGRPLSGGAVSYTAPGYGGLLDLAGQVSPVLQGLYQQGADRGIASNLNLLNQYTPDAMAYWQQTNPEVAGLRTGLYNRAQEDLAMGGQLDPASVYNITKNVRGNWAGRGLGNSLPAGLSEAMQLYMGGEQARQQRTQSAGSILGQLAGTQPDYAKFVLGLGGNPTGDALNLLGAQQGLAYQPLGFDPYNSAAVDASVAGGRNQMAQNMYQAQSLGSAVGGVFDLGMMGFGG